MFSYKTVRESVVLDAGFRLLFCLTSHPLKIQLVKSCSQTHYEFHFTQFSALLSRPETRVAKPAVQRCSCFYRTILSTNLLCFFYSISLHPHQKGYRNTEAA